MARASLCCGFRLTDASLSRCLCEVTVMMRPSAHLAALLSGVEADEICNSGYMDYRKRNGSGAGGCDERT